MDEQTLFEQIKELGYYLPPKSHSSSPGHPGLLVAIRATPTRMHFDPEGIHLALSSADGASESANLSLHSPFQDSRRVCPGQVAIHDRVDRRIHFFVFGGLLEAVFRPNETIYSFTSAAPILEITHHPESMSNQLAIETEAMLGGMKALWGLDDKGFTQRLNQIEPLELYRSSLHTILQRYERAPALRQSFREFYVALVQERNWLKLISKTTKKS